MINKKGGSIMEFGEKLKKLRDEKKLNQEQLANILNVSKSNVSKYENGIIEPNQETLKTIARYFNVTTDYLLGHTTDPKLNQKDEKDIATRLKLITEDLSSDAEIMFDGDIIDEETKELFMASLETVLKISKIKAKEKFTPKKYK